MLTSKKKVSYHFGPFTLSPSDGLMKGERRIDLQPKGLEMLRCLIINAPHIVTKDALSQQVWPDQFVEESTLSSTLRRLRAKMGDKARPPLYIETVPKQGYRLICQVEIEDLDKESSHVKELIEIRPLAVNPFDIGAQLEGLARFHDFIAAKLRAAAALLRGEIQEPTSFEVFMMLTNDQKAFYFYNLSQQAAMNLTGNQQTFWLDTLEGAYTDLRAALDHYHRSSDADSELQMANWLGRFWQISGRWAEGAEMLKRALGRRAPGLSALEAEARARLGGFLCSCNDYEPAKSSLLESVQISRAIENQQSLVFGLHWLAVIDEIQGRYSDAKHNHAEIIKAGEATGSARWVAIGLSGMGCIAEAEADYPAANQYHLKALSMYQELKDPNNTAEALKSMGVVACAQGDHAASRKYHEQSLPLMGGIRNQWGVGDCYFKMGLNEEADEQHIEAGRLYRQSLDTHRQTGDRLCAARAMEGIARITAIRGDEKQSARIFGAADGIRGSLGSPLSAAERKNYGRLVLSAQKKFLAQWNDGKRTGDV